MPTPRNEALTSSYSSETQFGAQNSPPSSERAGEFGRRRGDEAQAILATASAMLGRSLDLREAADAVARAALPYFADWALVDALDENGQVARLAIAHNDPVLLAAARELDRRWPPDFERRSVTREVLVTGEPVVVSDVRDEDFAPLARDAEHLAALKEFRARSCILVPLEAAGHRLGVLTLVASEGGRRYTADDLPLALELGQRATVTLVNARLYARERRAHADAVAARERTERLQLLSAELTRTLTPDAVVDVVGRHLVLALGARRAGVFELSEDGRELRVLGTLGVDSAMRERIARLSVDTPLPVGEAARTRAPVFIEDPEAWRAEHSDVAVEWRGEPRAWAALPLQVEEGGASRLLGALTVTLPGPHVFSDVERGFLQTFADQCAQALHRARLFAAEGSARLLAERLQSLIVALAHARTPDEVAQVVVREARAAVGSSTAGFALLAEDGNTFTMTTLVGVDENLREAWRTFPNSTLLPFGVVVAERAPLFFTSRAAYAARFPELESTLAGAGVEASAVLPLVTGDGNVFGGMHFDFATPREFSEAAREVFDSIAQHCTAAIERVHLYEAERAHVAAVEARREAETARAIAEAASRAKDELLAFVSHELRAPLAPARALAQILMHTDTLAPEFRETAAEIEQHIADEARLVENLLEYQRAGQELLAVQSHACDVGEIARLAVRAAAPAIRAKRIEVRESFQTDDAIAWVDPFRVQQIVYNLLTNAVEFSAEGAAVIIRTRNPAPGWVELAVTDAGDGIASDDLPRLFMPFTHVGSSKSLHSGLGLGLALSRRLAELQGGTLTATSPGLKQGATFVLRLPTTSARTISTPKTSTSSVAHGTDRALRILLLEDESSTADALRRLLVGHGHVVHAADTLDEAERIASREPFDVLLSDLRLRGETGLDAPHRIAEAARRRARPAPSAVALTGLTRDSDVVATRAAGFVAHLAKPVDEQELLEALRRAVVSEARR